MLCQIDKVLPGRLLFPVITVLHRRERKLMAAVGNTISFLGNAYDTSRMDLGASHLNELVLHYIPQLQDSGMLRDG